jgi:hypothetical protein
LALGSGDIALKIDWRNSVLHPINLPDCFDNLWLTLSLQETLLELSCNEDATDATVLNRDTEPALAGWLWRHKQKLLDPLAEFINHPIQAEKQAILDAFRHDITYHKHLEDPSFAFHLQPELQIPSHLAISVGKWLENFYDKIMQGIPAAAFGYTHTISSQLVYREFSDLNAQMRVCPVCDGTWMEPTSTGILGSVDHFLPRSKYPALSVHPFNLVLICETCNEDVKDNKDPLSDNQQRTLADVFVYCPQCRPSRPARDTLSVQVGPSTSHPWQLQCLRATPVQLSLFPDLYDLPGRWQVRQDEIDRIVRRRIRDCLRARQSAQSTITRNSFGALLGDLEQRMRGEWGEGAYLYPATWWLHWLQQYKFDDLVRDFGVGV